MATKLSTKNIPTSTGRGTPKIQPGTQIVTILSVGLEPFTFVPGGYHIVLNVEGPDLGAGFEGFNIDKNDPSKGKHKGQVGKVKANQYAYADKDIKTKKGEALKIERNIEMMKFLGELCTALGHGTWLDKQDGKHDTIEELFQHFNSDKVFANKPLRVCIAGKEYVNGQGYTNYDLNLPKSTSKGVAIELASVPEEKSRVIKFNEKLHITKKTAAASVTKFGDEPVKTASTAAPVTKFGDEPVKTAKVKNTDFEL